MEVKLEMKASQDRIWDVMTNISSWTETIQGVERIEIIIVPENNSSSSSSTALLLMATTLE